MKAKLYQMAVRQKVVEETISAAAHARAKYVKVYVSPESGRQVLDVMFLNGLRIHFDIPFGEPGQAIHAELFRLVVEFRPGLMDELKGSVRFIAECVADVLSVDGVLTPYEVGAGRMAARWEEKILFQQLKDSVPEWITYGVAVTTLRNHYGLQGPGAGPP